MSRRLLVVVGIGRSGTSLFTGILGQIGWYVPQPEVQADDTNPRGFGEPQWIVDFHTELQRDRRVLNMDSRPEAFATMAAVADDTEVADRLRTWLSEQFEYADHVVVKDPRIVWSLPVWQRCAADLRIDTSFATMLRYPTEVLTSARKWYGPWQKDISRAASWINVMLHTENFTRDSPRAFVRYDNLLSSWEDEVRRVATPLAAEWMIDALPAARPAIAEFVDPSLRRSQVGWDEVDVPDLVRTRVEKAWEELVPLTKPGGETPDRRAALDAALEDYCGLYRTAEGIAQLSISAARRKQPRPVAKKPPPPPPSRQLTIARRIPAPLRRLIPLRLRRRILGTG